MGLGSREKGFDLLSELVIPDFESRMSPELGGRVVSVTGLRVFIEALEQDFDSFHYAATEFVPGANGTIVAAGRIECRARASKMPLSSEFGHVWTIADGRGQGVVAHLSRDAALKAAGITSA